MISAIRRACAAAPFNVRFPIQLILTSLALGAWSTPVHATAFTPGNVVVASQQKIIEYTPAGVAVQTIAVPTGGGDGGLRDLMVDPNGNLQIYNGTFNPVLTQYNAAANTFTHRGGAGAFSTANNLSYGGLAVAGGFVYLTDMNTGGSPGAGLLRYALGGGDAVSVAPGEYIDVTLGRDGNLYALATGGPNAGSTGADVFDPVTGARLRSVGLATEVRAIAVDETGDIYGVDPFNPITHFDRNGRVINTIPDTIGGLIDIDINAQDQLVLASHSGEIAFTTTQLQSLTSFNHRHQTDLNFVAWAAPGTPVPEPSVMAPVLVLAAVIARRRPRPAVSRGSISTPRAGGNSRATTV